MGGVRMLKFLKKSEDKNIIYMGYGIIIMSFIIQMIVLYIDPSYSYMIIFPTVVISLAVFNLGMNDLDSVKYLIRQLLASPLKITMRLYLLVFFRVMVVFLCFLPIVIYGLMNSVYKTELLKYLSSFTALLIPVSFFITSPVVLVFKALHNTDKVKKYKSSKDEYIVRYRKKLKGITSLSTVTFIFFMATLVPNNSYREFGLESMVIIIRPLFLILLTWLIITIVKHLKHGYKELDVLFD
jgi:hypothetical protein